MEKIVKKVSSVNADELIKEMSLFQWEVVSKEENNSKVTIEFARDTSSPYYAKLVEYERQMDSFKLPPLWPLFMFVIISFALVTALLTMWIVLDTGFVPWIWFFALGLPAIVSSILASVYLMYRGKKVESVSIEMNRLRNSIKNKIDDLRREYGD
jgi:hypothetical protein